ncbi:arylesterase [Accumulibacter sp.]|uniref:arylesterase n=1 Tax=Accumulibacter sp. TaxID=2053492 RepID=UPI0028C38703|nr:arylesterase [Accumulibacter sp.]
MLRFLNCRCLLLAGLLLLAPTVQAARTILIFGDSLSAGYGIRQDAAWPALLAKRLHEKSLDYNVVNASISGETTSGGRARIDAALSRYSPQVVVLALGANDGLRGLPLAQLRDNLTAIVASAQSRKARVLLVGQRVPPNYGAYAIGFHDVFGAVARARKAALVDFLLDGVATQPKLFQADNLHPTAEAQPLLLDNVWRGLAPLLE